MSKYEAGQTVESIFQRGKMGTVVSTHKDTVEVRWDGTTESVAFHESHVEAKTINVKKPTQYIDMDQQPFKRGDYIEVDTKNHGIVRGAALKDWRYGGYSSIQMLTNDGVVLDLNSNWDKHTVIFRADIARGESPS